LEGSQIPAECLVSRQTILILLVNSELLIDVTIGGIYASYMAWFGVADSC